MEAYQNAALSPEERAKDLLSRLTREEKGRHDHVTAR